MNKRVLIISYYWPPSGGNGVQRWVKFVKHLRNFGWEPVIYTVENGEYPVLDQSLVKDIPMGVQVIKQPILEPYYIYKKLTGKKADSKISRDVIGTDRQLSKMEKLALWIRGNVFIPDARFLWIKPSVKYLARYVKENKFDLMVSTGPPHTDHLIALQLKRKTNIKWVADFRDPWTTMDYFADLNLSAYALKRHFQLEKNVLTEADAVVSVGNMMKKEFDEKRGSDTYVVTNGFDEDDFKGPQVMLSSEFTISHIGSFHQRRNPAIFWQAVSELVAENAAFSLNLKIRLIGKVDASILQVIKEKNLEIYLEYLPYLAHELVIPELKRTQLLLLPIDNFDGAKWVLTGKLFEYLAARRPILCIGPVDGDAAAVIAECNAGTTFDFADLTGLKKQLLCYFELYQENNLTVNGSSIDIFSRRKLTEKLVSIFNEITK